MLEPIAELETEGARMAVAPDGRRWAAVEGDHVTLWDEGKAAGALPPAQSALHEAFISADGERLLAAPERADLARREWDALPDLRAALGSATRDGARVVTAAWAPGEDALVVVSTEGDDQRVTVHDGEMRARQEVLWEDSEWMRVEAVAVSGTQIAAAALETRVWWRDGFVPAAVLADRDIQVRRLAFSPAGDLLAVTYADGLVLIAEAASGAERASWQAHEDEASALAFHPDGRRLATAGWDDRVALWDLGGTQLGEAPAGGHVGDLAFAGADRLVALRAAPDTGALLLAVGG